MNILDHLPDQSLLFIVGGDEPDRVRRIGSKIALQGSTDLIQLLGKAQKCHRLHVTRNYFRKGKQAEVDGYDCLLNLITEPEMGARSLEILRKLLRGASGRVVNRPEAVLQSSRDRVARRLAGMDGLLVPGTIRLPARNPKAAIRLIRNAGLEPPLILREAGTHGGKIVGLFETVDDLPATLDRTGDHFVTEFKDFQSPDGLYRKYRVFFIGSDIVLRHMLVSDHWNVHAKDRGRFMAGNPDLVAEESALFEDCTQPFSNDVMAVLHAVSEKMDLDFFGMDFGFAGDGRILLFEANATMSFFPFSADPQFAYLLRAVPPAQRAFRELLGLSSHQAA